MIQIRSRARRHPEILRIIAVALFAAGLSACATAPPATTAATNTTAPDDATVASDAPATLYVPPNLSVSSVDGEPVRREQAEAGRDAALSIRPGTRSIVVEWLGEDGESAGQVELSKTFEAGARYRLLRARTSVFLISGE